jgi:hypothetical protein
MDQGAIDLSVVYSLHLYLHPQYPRTSSDTCSMAAARMDARAGHGRLRRTIEGSRMSSAARMKLNRRSSGTRYLIVAPPASRATVPPRGDALGMQAL